MNDRHRRRGEAAAVVILVVLLASCSEEAIGPQFASDPAATRPPAASPQAATPVPVSESPRVATPAELADVLGRRGAPDRVFVVADGAVWMAPPEGGAERVYSIGDGHTLVGMDASPDGSQVALLLSSDKPGEGVEAVIVDDAARVVATIGGNATAAATPASNTAELALAIDWSPQGSHLLISGTDGAITTIALDGAAQPETIHAAERGDLLLDPMWSPTGESIAFMLESEGAAARSLRRLDLDSGNVETIVEPGSGRSVIDFAWLPDGRSLLFTEGGAAGAAITGIDLWKIDSHGEGRSLIASAGSVAPVARIALVRPSPDGRSVAYVALVPGPSGPQLDSLWVRDIGTGTGFRVELFGIAAISDMSWTQAGLVLDALVIHDDGVSREILRIGDDGAVQFLWRPPISAATPVAGTPVATPAA